MTRTLILPGFMGSAPDHWQQHWLADHPDARIVAQERWDAPRLADWQQGLEEALADEDDVVLVAHSLGCLLAAHLANRQSSAKIRAALLVAPCHLDRAEHHHPGAIHFGAMPERRLPFPSLVVASLNDPYMPFGECRRFATLWGSDLIDLGYAGHINVASGFGHWPGGYGLLSLLQRNRSRSSGSLVSAASQRALPVWTRDRRPRP